MHLFSMLLSSAVLLLAPVLLAGVGETIGELAGILNVGIEGVMLFGAFVSALVLSLTGGGLLVATVLAIPAGVVVGGILGYLYIERCANQVVAGIVFNILILGFTTLLYERYLTNAGEIHTFSAVAIPGLSAIPIVGRALFDEPVLIYLAYLIAGLVAYLLRRTWLGMALRAAGEQPLALDVAGVSVWRVRWVAVLAASCLASLGGAAIVVLETGGFVPDVTSGEGFIALAVVILGRWRISTVLLGTLLFGVADALQFQVQTIASLAGVSRDVWLSLPYVVTIAAITLGRRAHYPAATAVPYPRRARRSGRFASS